MAKRGSSLKEGDGWHCSEKQAMPLVSYNKIAIRIQETVYITALALRAFLVQQGLPPFCPESG